jgi:cell wall-associated NlpC family hydrolase
MTTRAEITAAALSMVGTPFHANQRTPGVGMDCVGVLVCVARACGIPVEDRLAYSLQPNGELQGELESRLVRVHSEPQEGDILMMQLERMGEPHHVAIVISDSRIVHAHAKARRTVMQSHTDYWRSVTRAVYRFKGVV